MLSCHAEILTHTIGSCKIPSHMAFYHTLFNAYGQICITSLQGLAASSGGT